MQKYIVLLPHYEKTLDTDFLIKKFKESSWKISRREYAKRDVKYFRFTKDYKKDLDGYIFSVNVFLFPKINLFIYLFNLKSAIDVKEKEIIKTTELFTSIVIDELIIEEYLPDRLIPFFIESYSNDEKSSFEVAKEKLFNNCYFCDTNGVNELYLGKDSATKIEILLIKTSFEESFSNDVLKQMILIKSLKEYSVELSNILMYDSVDENSLWDKIILKFNRLWHFFSDLLRKPTAIHWHFIPKAGENRKLEIYAFIWNYLLYIDKSPINGIFSQYLTLSLKPLERLLEYREQNNSKNIINVLGSIHTAEKVLLTLTFIVIVDIISKFSEHSSVLIPYLNTIFPNLEIYIADILIIIISIATIYLIVKYFNKIFWE